MTFPALDLGGFTRRSIIPAEYIQLVEGFAPGFTQQRIIARTSRLYAQLRKRYGASDNGTGSGIPWGGSPASFDISGTAPPLAVLSGVPTVGSLQVLVQITLGGPLGTAQFQISIDNGASQLATAVPTAATYVIPGTGLTVAFPAGTYSTDNVYSAPTPVPEAVLGWLTDLVSVDVMKKRGANSNDPAMGELIAAANTALAECEQAANSKEGLFDLPVDDSGGSDIRTGGPLFYTETSPYVSADIAEFIGTQQDYCRNGTQGGT
jgi:hypothetical protein